MLYCEAHEVKVSTSTAKKEKSDMRIVRVCVSRL